MNTCSLSECSRPRHAHGLCGMHAQRHRRTGDPRSTRRPGTVEAFWRRVDKASDPDGHWLWTGDVQENGYGRISTTLRPTASGTRLAHRVAWELVHGPISEGLMVDHVCRVKLCVRPDLDHLEPVPGRENVHRGLHGVLRTHCKYGHELTPENTQYDAKRNCRRCRTCARVWDARSKDRRRGLRPPIGASVRAMYGSQQ